MWNKSDTNSDPVSIDDLLWICDGSYRNVLDFFCHYDDFMTEKIINMSESLVSGTAIFSLSDCLWRMAGIQTVYLNRKK